MVFCHVIWYFAALTVWPGWAVGRRPPRTDLYGGAVTFFFIVFGTRFVRFVGHTEIRRNVQGRGWERGGTCPGYTETAPGVTTARRKKSSESSSSAAATAAAAEAPRGDGAPQGGARGRQGHARGPHAGWLAHAGGTAGRLRGAGATEDLPYFSNLAYLDLGINAAPLEPLGALPALRELRMHCNRLRTLEAPLAARARSRPR